MKAPKNLFALSGVLLAASALLAVTATFNSPAQAAPKPAGAQAFLQNPQKGNPGLKSIGKISFGPHGLLLIAEPRAASFVAIATGDTGPVQKLKQRIGDVEGLLAARMGGAVQINDLAVNPASGKIYLSITRQTDKQTALITIDADGRAQDFSFENVEYVRVGLPRGENSQVRNIAELAFAKDRVILAGASNEEFSSKIYSVPLPLTHGVTGTVLSAETYHVSHRKWETKAPIQSFIPHEENGKHYIVGAFACTPIAKFPLDGLASGEKVQGVSVVELGSGNRPLNMLSYEKGGRKWVVTTTQRFRDNLFGPSKYWGVRIDAAHITVNEPGKINENAVRRNVKESAGPAGIEIVDALFGVVKMGQLQNDEIVVLRENEGKHALELARLP
jgi:hypothetical protein